MCLDFDSAHLRDEFCGMLQQLSPSIDYEQAGNDAQEISRSDSEYKHPITVSLANGHGRRDVLYQEELETELKEITEEGEGGEVDHRDGEELGASAEEANARKASKLLA